MAVVIESASKVGIPSSIGSYGKPSGGVTVHYIGASHVSRGSHANCRRQVRGWHSYHKNGNGWAGIGYNFLICHHGIVLTGRGLYRIGAHNAVANSTYQGVCFMIGGNQQPTAKQLKGFRDLMKWMRGKGVNTGNIKGHRDHISTSCPGNVLYGRVRANNWGSGGTVKPIGGGSGGGGGTGGGMTSVRSIKSQQKTVNQEGYSPKLDVDGIYGPKTEAGVKWYQRKLGVSVDGLWGPKTEAAHKRNEGGGSSKGNDLIVPSGKPYLKMGSKGTKVRRLQKCLKAAGESLPRFGVDGHFGAETREAVRGFQRSAGIGVDGIYGPQTERALRKRVK